MSYANPLHGLDSRGEPTACTCEYPYPGWSGHHPTCGLEPSSREPCREFEGTDDDPWCARCGWVPRLHPEEEL